MMTQDTSITQINKMTCNYWVLANLLVLVLILGTSVVRGEVPAVIVFGDSTVDSGNNNLVPTVLKSNIRPYGRDFKGGRPTGRFCNGRLPPDFISESFGLKSEIPAYLDPAFGIADFATGVCFASAGTGYDKATSDILNVIPLKHELLLYKDYQRKLRGYLGQAKAKQILTNALYLLSIGTNDFLENYFVTLKRRSEFTVSQYSDFLVSLSEKFIREMYGLGLRKLSITGTPPMGCLPLERTLNLLGNKECNELYNNVSLDFNAKQATMVRRINRELVGIKVVNSNPYFKLLDIIHNPSKYGFVEAARGCCGTGMTELGYTCNELSPFTCPDANKFVFWDAFHPTEKTNSLLSDYIVAKYLHVFR